MKKSMLSLLTGVALLGAVGVPGAGGVASADEPITLTNSAMDEVTAGRRVFRTLRVSAAIASNICRNSVCLSSAVVQSGLGNTATVVQIVTDVDINVLNRIRSHRS